MCVSVLSEYSGQVVFQNPVFFLHRTKKQYSFMSLCFFCVVDRFVPYYTAVSICVRLTLARMSLSLGPLSPFNLNGNDVTLLFPNNG